MDNGFVYPSSERKFDCVELARIDSIKEHCKLMKNNKHQGCFWQCLQFTNDPSYGCEYYET